MSGPDHYQEAERLLARANELEYPVGCLRAAQVHATLALAAATALGLDPPSPDYQEWKKTCGVTYTEEPPS